MNYNGDVTESINSLIESGESLGPDYYGNKLWPVKATYHEIPDITVVEFSRVKP